MSDPSRGGKPVIGVVGGIGSGKSTAAREFSALGSALIDADRIGHELLRRPDVRDEVRRRWGDRVFGPDGEVSRPALAEVVFDKPDELSALNAIVHPKLRREMETRIAAAQADPAVAGVVLDAAVLFEAGWDDLCTDLVFVSSPGQARLERVSRERGWDERQWSARENSQISLDTKASRCEYTIDNRFSASFLREQVRVIFHRIRQKD